MTMQGRNYTSETYRFGYQGSEKETGVSGMYTTEYRALDVRLGRWFMPDPVVKPWQTPYCSMDNNPIALTDIMGLDPGGPGGGGGQSGAPAGQGAGEYVSVSQGQGNAPNSNSGIFVQGAEAVFDKLNQAGAVAKELAKKESIKTLTSKETQWKALVSLHLFSNKLNEIGGGNFDDKIPDDKIKPEQLFYQWVKGKSPKTRTFTNKSFMGKQMMNAPEVKAAVEKKAIEAARGNIEKRLISRSASEEKEGDYVKSFVKDLKENRTRAFHGSWSGTVEVESMESDPNGGVNVTLIVKINDDMHASSGTRLPPFLGGYDNGKGGVNSVFPDNPFGTNGQLSTIKVGYVLKFTIHVNGNLK